jgi:hypothetical protein
MVHRTMHTGSEFMGSGGRVPGKSRLKSAYIDVGYIDLRARDHVTLRGVISEFAVLEIEGVELKELL